MIKENTFIIIMISLVSSLGVAFRSVKILYSNQNHDLL